MEREQYLYSKKVSMRAERPKWVESQTKIGVKESLCLTCVKSTCNLKNQANKRIDNHGDDAVILCPHYRSIKKA